MSSTVCLLSLTGLACSYKCLPTFGYDYTESNLFVRNKPFGFTRNSPEIPLTKQIDSIQINSNVSIYGASILSHLMSWVGGLFQPGMSWWLLERWKDESRWLEILFCSWVLQWLSRCLFKWKVLFVFQLFWHSPALVWLKKDPCFTELDVKVCWLYSRSV